ncbi:amino acid ABC transporter substrate-binding protein [Limnobacter humi]|uniref:Amino acid ABC transporter substrate-binding protein n=1 Tax=Limnobacter humi TaxID=1778671 RepID=A0ABT1WDT1_9BURK|nr:amino acid ABC transporter substrate-binding protein [Limnobacter humi]MCQ8895683.1 amino acid ABC transporter substrate-binding protein [Limnobacter humi]
MSIVKRATWLWMIGLVVLVPALVNPACAGDTLTAVKARGVVRCGVSSGVAGFSAIGSDGQWVGLDVSVCRAIAAAVLGDARKVEFTPLSSQQRFAALQAGQIDVLSRNTTWTLSRDAGLGVQFTGISYFDGQGILVHKRFKVKHARELNGAEICVQSGTTNEKNLATYLATQGIRAKIIVYDQFEPAYKAFFSGRCQAFSTDVSALVSLKSSKSARPDDFEVLPEVFSKEPLGPAVRSGDSDWFAIVKWVLYALLEAEELGVGQANLAQAARSGNPAVLRLLGQAEDIGKPLGLPRDWVATVLAQVGNYGEVYERTLGQQSPLQLPRGLNALWTKGGLMYAPPLR